MIPWTSEIITTLKNNEVFVFGSNETGFHGAGAAGLAMRGDASNNWRQDPAFLKAIKADPGTRDAQGLWAVLGIPRGFQEGTQGSSYAISTVIRPGAKKSISKREIYYQLERLWKFITSVPEKIFLITPLGEGYAGWTFEEMNEVWEYLIKVHGLPTNIRFVGRTKNIKYQT